MRILDTIFGGTLAKLSVALLAVGFAVSGCDLTRYPTKTIPLESSLVTYDDAVGYNRGIMTQFRNRVTGVFVTPQEIMADCINANASWGNNAPELHGWTELTASTGTFATVYSWYYMTLKNVNYTLEKYSSVQENLRQEMAKEESAKRKKELEGQINDIDLFIGVSHFARAYYYYNLLLRYAQPYDAATETTALGVPLVLVFDVSKSVQRASVKECYDQIFKDLEEAGKVLQRRKSAPGSDEFTPDCITALRARMALERKEYDKAYTYAMELINSGRYPLIEPTKEAFTKMWLHDEATEDILQLYIDKEEDTYGMGSYYGYSAKHQWHNPTYYPTQGLLDMYSDKDLRKDAYFYLAPKAHIGEATYESQLYIIKKFMGNPEYYTTPDEWGNMIPNGEHRPRVFRIAEQYLIAAEAAYFAGKDAKTPLNALRMSRGLDPVESTGDALLKDIQDERLRELMGEGFRLWDLRRWGLGVERMAPQSLRAADGTLMEKKDYLAAPFFDLKIKAGDPRFVWAIPQREVNTYGAENMPQNPGW